MVANTKVNDEAIDENDQTRFRSTQRSRSSHTSDDNDRPITQPAEKDADTENEHDVEECRPLTQRRGKHDGLHSWENISRKISSDRLEIRTKNQEGVTFGGNIAVQVGGKALGQPYGLKGGNVYILCDVLDHRITKSCIDGKEKEEFKCAFHSKELRASGKIKQWLPQWRVVSSDIMAERIEGALGLIATKERSETMSNIADEVAREANVDIDFVQEIVKKRKAIRHVGNKRTKKSRA